MRVEPDLDLARATVAAWRRPAARAAAFTLVVLAVFSFGGYLLFIVAFQTRFPMGPVEAVLHRVF